MNITILRFDSIDSTNIEALKQAKQGAEEGLCIIAKRQTSGRGRHGRSWESPEGAGLYFSIVLRPRLDAASMPLITLMAGIAVYETLAGLGIRPDIKWVNDIYVNDKKISGILAETAAAEEDTAVIVGIGINVTSANFSEAISDTATSIEAETGRPAEMEDLIASLIHHLRHFYSMLNGPDGAEQILDEWRQRSSYFSGKLVRVLAGSETVEGVTDGLEPDGALRILTSSGELRIIRAGDVHRLRSGDNKI